MLAVQVQDLKKDYGGFVVKIPQLELPEGYVTGLVGKNGSGKTTLIRMLLGLIPKTSGTAKLLDGEMGQNPVLRSQVGFVSETPYFLPTLTTGQVHDTLSPFYVDWDEALYQQMMQDFEVPNIRIKQLSKGQSKIFTFIMAFCCCPRLLILDEPTANLEPSARHKLIGYLRRFMEEEEHTVLYSTHITGDLEDICDYLVGMEHGQVLYSGEKDAILDSYLMVQGPVQLLTPDTLGVFCGVERSGVGFTGLTDRPKEARALFGREAQYRRPTIEELIVYREGVR